MRQVHERLEGPFDPFFPQLIQKYRYGDRNDHTCYNFHYRNVYCIEEYPADIGVIHQ
ncbi:hypothetical protein D3C71_1613930 [compost metagenome]